MILWNLISLIVALATIASIINSVKTGQKVIRGGAFAPLGFLWFIGSLAVYLTN